MVIIIYYHGLAGCTDEHAENTGLGVEKWNIDRNVRRRKKQGEKTLGNMYTIIVVVVIVIAFENIIIAPIHHRIQTAAAAAALNRRWRG